MLKKIIIIVTLFFTSLTFAQYTNESEATTVITSGNSQMQNLGFKTANQYQFEKNIAQLKGEYTYGEADNIRSTEQWKIQPRYERQLSDTWSLFISELVESDRFAGYARRYNSDLGAKFIFIKSEKNQTSSELGYRYTIEQRKNPKVTLNDSKARLYLETIHNFNSDLLSKLWFEYLPNLSESDDYILSFEPSISFNISKIFSLKMAYRWNYDNEPAVNKGKHDTMYTTSLIAKF